MPWKTPVNDMILSIKQGTQVRRERAGHQKSHPVRVAVRFDLVAI
jgi:hypothetical protein